MLMVLRKLLVVINLRLLVNSSIELIVARRNVKKKIAQYKSGKHEDVSALVERINVLLSKNDNIKTNENTEFNQIDASMFSQDAVDKKEDVNE
jgi:hypothetical protein